MALFAQKWMPRPDNENLRKLFTQNVPDTVRWLMGLGVGFVGPFPEPPHRRARMHNVLPTSGSYIYHLSRRARRLGVDIRLRMRAVRFLVKAGRVVGVVCTDFRQREVTLRARGGLVLASGDFTANPELKAAYISPRVAAVQPVNPGSTGDGHLMAMQLGAKVLNGDVLPFFVRFISPPRTKLIQLLPPWRPITWCLDWAMRNLPATLLRPFLSGFLTTVLAPSGALFQAGAILVNAHGERFTDERRDLSSALADQPEHAAFIVFDQAIAEKFSKWPNFISTAPGVGYAYLQDYRRSRKDIYFQAETVQALARKLNVPEAALHTSISSLAAQSEAGEAEQRTWSGPLHALGPVKILLTLSDGGLDVADNLQVKDAQGLPIAGLFAAGSVGQGGLLLEGHGHHLGWAFTSGRIAGRNAAHQALTPVTIKS